MTAAIDRFLYRATADAVAERVQDAYCDLANVFDELEEAINDIDGNPTWDELMDLVQGAVACKNALYRTLDNAETHILDFVEANRP